MNVYIFFRIIQTDFLNSAADMIRYISDINFVKKIMELTSQYIRNSTDLVIFTEPITKLQAAEIWVRVYPNEDGQSNDFLQNFTNILAQFDDKKFIQEFNKLLNLKIRLFAPGLFQIVYTKD